MHVIVNHEPAAVTGSLKVTMMSAPSATPVAPFAGVVVWTAGAGVDGRRDGDVVDADPLVAAGGVGRDHPHLDERLVLRGGRQLDARRA